MFYQIKIGITGITSWFEKNINKEECFTNYLCPFLNKEITLMDGQYLFNMSSYGYLIVYESDRVVDSNWPISKEDFEKDGTLDSYKYDREFDKAIKENAKNVTTDLFHEAISLIESGKYLQIREQIKRDLIPRTAFFICPFDDPEIDHNYEFVIKPLVEKYQYSIHRADEISHTRTINEVIISQINKSSFIIADLSNQRPNCYYEVGYAHSLGKPVIILAKEGTERHFDISTYKWNYWQDYRDLKPKLEKELSPLINQLNSKK